MTNRHRKTPLFFAFCSMLATGACGGSPAESDASVDAPSDGQVAQLDVCDELGLPREPMRPGTGSNFDDIAGDFTVQTLDGPWTLSEHWTGCDSYVFINYARNAYGEALFSGVLDGLLVESPRNVHYFFGSYEDDPAAIRARMEGLAGVLEDGFEYLETSEADREHWRSRMHFVVEPIQEVQGSVGDLVRGQALIQHTFAIMRDQRFDPVGSLHQLRPTGFTPDIAMAAFAGHYYNYLAALRERLAAENATVVRLLDESDVTARVLDATATLPDAATMATFDTLEVDVEVHCRQSDPAECSEWDRIAYVHLCDDEECTTAHEIARWITPYSRPGRMRWVWDASPMLPLMRDGGARRFRVTTGPEWEEPTLYDVRAELRFSNRGGPRAVAAELAFTGGDFDASYNESRAPFVFTPPEGTTKVELAVIVSGHGQAGPANCAEWCNHEHTFTLGSKSYRIDFPDEAGQPLGCARRANEGVVPGQWGNWAPSRAGWCPGLPVDVRRIDLTSAVDLDGENSLTYSGSFMGGPPPGGENVVIDLSAYVVFYR